MLKIFSILLLQYYWHVTNCMMAHTEDISSCQWSICDSSYNTTNNCCVDEPTCFKQRTCYNRGVLGISSWCCRNSDYSGQKLFLTPLIATGNIANARRMARVRNLSDIISYSGFFTVNENINSNLFFWFFPATYNPNKAPLLLWLNGGPGLASVFSIFVENGPFEIDFKFYLKKRKTHWALTNSIIYIDSPVGTGFSFTEDESGYAENQDDVSRDLYNALSQFFIMFPEYRRRDFFCTGKGFAGTYCPVLAQKIDKENLKSPEKIINLRGIAISSPATFPLAYLDYGEFLYQIGLLDLKQKTHFDDAYSDIKELVKDSAWHDTYGEIYKIVDVLVKGYDTPYPSYITNVTGFTFYYNYLYPTTPYDYEFYIEYLKLKNVRDSIHVGDQPYYAFNKTVLNRLSHQLYRTEKPLLEELLDKNYRVLLVGCQLNIIIPSPSVDRLSRSLKWRGAKKYRMAERKFWIVNNELAGYSKTSNNFVHLFIRHAGHVASHDQPEWSFDMINRFTRGQQF